MFSYLNLNEIIIFIISLIVSLAIHEAMHAYTSHALGDRTAFELGRLTLNPLKHVDLYTSVMLPLILVLLHLPPFFIAKPVPFDPHKVRYGEFGVAMVGLAGPISNLVLAALVALFARATGVAIGTETFTIVSIFILVNISFFVFNMIPFPPLDGSRLLYAFAPDWLRTIMESMEQAGILPILIFMFVIFGFLSNTFTNITTAIYNFLLG